MLDDYFTRPEILRRHRAGHFGAYLDTYTSTARERGYSWCTVRAHCYLIRLFGEWLEHRGLCIDEIDDDVITEFWRKRRRQVPRVQSMGTAPLRHLIAHLREQGMVPEQPRPTLTEAAILAHRFGEYLGESPGWEAESAFSEMVPTSSSPSSATRHKGSSPRCMEAHRSASASPGPLSP